MTSDALTIFPSDTGYPEAEAIARRMSDLDLLKVARSLSCGQCNGPELVANHEVNRRFERRRERFVEMNLSVESLTYKHAALQERFDTLVAARQRAQALLEGHETMPGDPVPNQQD